MPTQPEKQVHSVLPIPDLVKQSPTTYDGRDPDSNFLTFEPLRPPDGAPNVLIILLDDVGFGTSSDFGGPCHTPVAERLAANGLKYNRFHTKALCAATLAGAFVAVLKAPLFTAFFTLMLVDADIAAVVTVAVLISAMLAAYLALRETQQKSRNEYIRRSAS